MYQSWTVDQTRVSTETWSQERVYVNRLNMNHQAQRNGETRYPTGSVVVSVHDLASELHRPPERIAKALGLLHSQQKAERAPLTGYWKLNVES